MVHLEGANLNFKGYSRTAYNRGVERLVHIRLRGGNIVLKPIGYRAEHIVHNTENIVAVRHGVGYNSYGVNIVNFVKVLALNIHFAIYAVY